MARNAEDCAIVYSIIYGKDPLDPTTSEFPFGFDKTKEITSLKVGYLKKDIEKDTSKSKDNLTKALDVFKRMGIKMDSLELPR
ncbi:amidase family protein [Maribacter litopenaei]|uniref:Amidase family protein n=1 Tax=Maribacter litopenaei TaxID=2976127 RepID=A0ABY5Y8T3_9FLAO|nr:amidase family protein [Maribacter litopenaei]UWX54659.1 amidase family protein [Maribacter litopenaei]